MKKIALFALLIVSGSCKNDKENHAFAKAEQVQISNQFNDWLEEQFQKDLARDPQMQTQMGIKTNYGQWTDISSARDLEDKELAESRLNYLNKEVETAALEGQDLLSYRLYKSEQEQKIADFDYRLYSYPVNQMHGMQAEIPAFLINMHQVSDESDALAYIERLKGIQPLFEELVNNLSLENLMV